MTYGFMSDEQKRYYEIQQQNKQEDYMREVARQIQKYNPLQNALDQAAMQKVRITVEPEAPRKILLLLPKKGK